MGVFSGSWAPYQIPLESIKNIAEQKNVINAILKQGYNEYYFLVPHQYRPFIRAQTYNTARLQDLEASTKYEEQKTATRTTRTTNY
jgi:hypothetical protein